MKHIHYYNPFRQRKINLLFLLCILTISSLFAQQSDEKGSIEGKIVDQEGVPVSFASVVLKETTIGAFSDLEGKFRFSAPTGSYILIVSVIGYHREEIAINVSGNQITKIDFELTEETQELSSVIVEGNNPDEEIILESRTALKSNTGLMDTPAPIVIVGKDLLDQQANTTLQETIRNISGVSQAGNNYGIGDNLIIRGLDANYAYDGMYGGGSLGNNFNPVRTLTNIERIEVLKGTATGLYGIGSAGGVINLIEKKPLDVQQGTAQIQLGRWNRYKGMVDFTAPLSDQFSYRLILSKEKEDGYRGLYCSRDELHGSLRFKPSNNHSIIVSGSFVFDENQVESVGHPVRLFNADNLSDPSGSINDGSLFVDTDRDGDGIVGHTYTEEQRDALAASVRSNDGLQPYDLGDISLISPLSTPAVGEDDRVKIRYDWDISDNWRLTQQAQYRYYETDYTRQTGAFNYVLYQDVSSSRGTSINGGVRSPLVLDDVIYPFAARRQEYRHVEARENAYQSFTDVQGNWNAGSMKGEHLISFNWELRDVDYMQWSTWDADDSRTSNPVPYIFDIRNPNWPTGTFWDYDPSLRSNYNKKIRSYGISLQEVLYINDQITGRFGGAMSEVKQFYTQRATDSVDPESELSTDDSGFSYNFGLNYHPIKQWSLFVNYSKGRTAYSTLGSLNQENNRDDSESLSLDAGLRFSGFEDKFYISAVAFETKRTNVGYGNPDYIAPDETGYDPNNPKPFYLYDQEDRARGIEFDLTFKAAKNLSLNTNATFMKAINIKGDDESEQAKGVPTDFIRFWGQYTLFPEESRLPVRLNFGMRYESDRSINSSAFDSPDAFIPSYFVYDAGLSFDYKVLNIRINVENLFNERYYSKAMFLGALPGETRNANITINYKF